MKVMYRDYPIFSGIKPRVHPDVSRHIETSEFRSEYEAAYKRLLACDKYRVIRQPVFDHIWNSPNLAPSLAKLSNEAKMEPCWYAYRGATIGICRSSEDMAFIVLAQRDEVIAGGGVFLTYENDNLHHDFMTSEDALMAGLTKEQIKEYHQAVAVTMGAIVPTFIEFADLEIVVISAKGQEQRRAKIEGEKFITDIASRVEIIDSGWYRRLVRDGDFGVTGHFRLQPYGPGGAQRKLIWIKDFVKHGYTRKARIEG